MSAGHPGAIDPAVRRAIQELYPEQLTPEEVEQVAPFISLLIRDPLLQYEHYRPGTGGMSPAQEEIHRSQAKNRLVRAANQVGKTHALCAEIHWQGLGTHPFRTVSRALKTSYCIIKDFESGYPEFCSKLRNLQPPDALHPKCHYTKAGGYSYLEDGKRHTWIVYADGYQIEFKSGTQDVLAMAGATVDAVFFDEPPKAEHWAEARARLSVSNGPTLIAFTAVGRPLKWLRKEIEGDPETGAKAREHWDSIVIGLDAKTSPHRTAESIAAQIARNEATGQGEQRTRGGWEGKTAGATFTGLSEEDGPRGNVAKSEAAILAMPVDAYRLSADYGEGPGKTHIFLLGIQGTRPPYKFLVLGEYFSKETTTPAMDAAGVRAMFVRANRLAPIPIPIAGISKAFGDVNSAGKNGGGSTCNIEMAKELARVFGYPPGQQLPFEFEVPDKRGGSVALGTSAINVALMEGRLLISPHCEALLQSLRHFTGKEEELKHALDSLRYGLDGLLYASGESKIDDLKARFDGWKR